MHFKRSLFTTPQRGTHQLKLTHTMPKKSTFQVSHKPSATKSGRLPSAAQQHDHGGSASSVSCSQQAGKALIACCCAMCEIVLWHNKPAQMYSSPIGQEQVSSLICLPHLLMAPATPSDTGAGTTGATVWPGTSSAAWPTFITHECCTWTSSHTM
jgi:hypothetical protein